MEGANAFSFDTAGLQAAVAANSLEPFLKAAQQTLDDGAWTALVADAVEAHHSSAVNLLAALSAATNERVNYSTQRFLGLALPQLKVPFAALVDLLEKLTHRTGAEDIPYYLTSGVGGWCEANPGSALEVATAIRVGQAPADLLRVVLLAGLRVDRLRFLPLLLDLLRTGSDDQRCVAVSLLGAFEGFAPTELDQVITALALTLDAASGAERTAPLRALLDIALRVPGKAAAGLRAIDVVAPEADRDIREAIASELMFKRGPLPGELVEASLWLLRNTQSDEASTIDSIDHFLSQRLQGPLSGEMTALLDHLLAERVTKLKVLDATRDAILRGTDNLLTATVTRWLVSDRLAHTRAVNALCRNVAGNPLEFSLDFSGCSLTPRQAERIARRSCAILMVYPETVASILVSLLRTGPAAAQPAIERLFVNPLLITYWTGPRKTIEAVAANAPPDFAASLVRVLAAHDAYKEGVEAVRGLKELHPSQHHRFLAATKKREENRAINKAAYSQSIFGSLIPASIILYGDSTVYEMHIADGKTVRQETALVSREFSHELPRLDVIDPFGSWYQRLVLLRDEADE